MKKFAIMLAVLLFGATSILAQTNQVATLCHENQITLYYGYDALQQAYEVATDGDIITLSSGSFSSIGSQTNNITLRGAGMMPDGTSTTIIGLSTFYSDATIEGVFLMMM